LNLINRRTETEEQILNRLQNAEVEMEQGKSPGIFDHILYNDNLDDCYESLKVMLCCLTLHPCRVYFQMLYIQVALSDLLQKLLGIDGAAAATQISGKISVIDINP
jgi:hypothetical protein